MARSKLGQHVKDKEAAGCARQQIREMSGNSRKPAVLNHLRETESGAVLPSHRGSDIEYRPKARLVGARTALTSRSGRSWHRGARPWVLACLRRVRHRSRRLILPARKSRAAQQCQLRHFRCGSWPFRNVLPQGSKLDKAAVRADFQLWRFWLCPDRGH